MMTLHNYKCAQFILFYTVVIMLHVHIRACNTLVISIVSMLMAVPIIQLELAPALTVQKSMAHLHVILQT